MPQTLAPIPSGVQIVDPREGAITDFYRLRWQQLIDGFTRVGTVATLSKDGQTAALTTTAVYTTKATGRYRLNWYLRKTVADGVSSSLTVTWGWTESGNPLTEAEAALTTDTSDRKSTRLNSSH